MTFPLSTLHIGCYLKTLVPVDYIGRRKNIESLNNSQINYKTRVLRIFRLALIRLF